MKRLARLVQASGFALGLLAITNQAALATPFSDVPANHWAYQYIQSLAADGLIDGYPDGKFKGDRPLTRYEMAVIVARVVAKLQENQSGVTKADLDKLQKLIDALKDELDALGVRVTNLEDSLDALDKRTKFAQSLSMHGVFQPNLTWRERPINAQSIVNGTDATVATYWGTSIAPGHTTTIDPFVQAFLVTDDSNSALTYAGSGVQIRQDTRFSLAYQITDKLSISLPVHILNFEYGGEYTQNAKFDIEPGVDVNLSSVGAVSNLDFKFGIIDNMPSSRTGLTFRAPQGYNGAIAYELPFQPFQKGAAVSGTVGEGAFGSTDFFASFTRIDQTLLNTQTAETDPNTAPGSSQSYLFPIVAPQYGYVAAGAAGVLRTDTFNAGSSTLAGVYLTNAAVLGSAYVSYYNGTSYNSAGAVTGGPANPLPAITYNQAYNSIVFGFPLPAGSVVSITYRAVTVSNNTNYQRYMVNGRLNQKFKSLSGLEVGVSYNRVFDFDDTQTTNDVTFVNQATVQPFGLVSDTVLGVDAQVPIPVNIAGPGTAPVIFGETAESKYTPDYHNVPAVGDTAYVAGLKLKAYKIAFTAQYQQVGPNYLDGAPFRYYGNAPPLFSFWKEPYLPGFYGFANNLGINQQFDGAFAHIGAASPGTSVNPNLTFAYPVFNPFQASGPTYYQAFTPNTQGVTLSANAPIRVGGSSGMLFTTNIQYQGLQEMRPNSEGSMIYGPAYASSVRMKYNVYTGNAGFAVPAFGQKLAINIGGGYDTLQRPDTTAYQYYPINPTTQTFDNTSYLAAQGAFGAGGSPVSFYPNYVNMTHAFINLRASMPLSADLSLIGTYSQQHYAGEYGTTISQNISENKYYWTGALQYNIPKTNSSLSVQSRQYRYTDAVLPTYNSTENRQDVFFTVRF